MHETIKSKHKSYMIAPQQRCHDRTQVLQHHACIRNSYPLPTSVTRKESLRLVLLQCAQNEHPVYVFQNLIWRRVCDHVSQPPRRVLAPLAAIQPQRHHSMLRYQISDQIGVRSAGKAVRQRHLAKHRTAGSVVAGFLAAINNASGGGVASGIESVSVAAESGQEAYQQALLEKSLQMWARKKVTVVSVNYLGCCEKRTPEKRQVVKHSSKNGKMFGSTAMPHLHVDGV